MAPAQLGHSVTARNSPFRDVPKGELGLNVRVSVSGILVEWNSSSGC